MLKKKNLILLVGVFAAAINGLIIASFFSPKLLWLQGYGTSALPLVNAILNGGTFVALSVALFAIKQKKIQWHRRFIFMAFSFTFLFLISYLLYHFSTPSTKYGGSGTMRFIYLFVLLTHVVLAALIVPIAMFTMGLAIKGNIVMHRKMAKWAMPVWLYVSLTGVIVYWMIAPYYVH